GGERRAGLRILRHGGAGGAVRRHLRSLFGSGADRHGGLLFAGGDPASHGGTGGLEEGPADGGGGKVQHGHRQPGDGGRPDGGGKQAGVERQPGHGGHGEDPAGSQGYPDGDIGGL